MKNERAHPAKVLIIPPPPCHPARTLKAAASGKHHTELGEDFCLLLNAALLSRDLGNRRANVAVRCCLTPTFQKLLRFSLTSSLALLP